MRRQQGLGIDARTATPDGVAPALDVDFALYALMPPLEEIGPPEGGGAAPGESPEG
jgi:hypothetical protein